MKRVLGITPEDISRGNFRLFFYSGDDTTFFSFCKLVFVLNCQIIWLFTISLCCFLLYSTIITKLPLLCAHLIHTYPPLYFPCIFRLSVIYLMHHIYTGTWHFQHPHIKEGPMKKHIHIFGASGSGTTTISQKVCGHTGYSHFDSDSYFWLSPGPPLQSRAGAGTTQPWWTGT